MNRLLIPILLIALVVAACGEGEPGAGPFDPTGGWVLASGTVGGQPLNLIATHPVTLEFEDGRVGGTSACNSYGGEFSTEGGTISLGQIAMTEMACGPAAVMDLESAYLSALFTVDTISTSDGDLVLSGERVELVFEPVEPPPTAALLGTVWLLDTLIEGDAASSVGETRATIEFFTDGSFIASTGCRTAAGNYEATTIGIDVPNMTMSGDCPGDLQAQDSLIVSVVGDGFTVELDGQTMTLSSQGGVGLIYHAEN